MSKFEILTAYIPKIEAVIENGGNFADEPVLWDFERDVHTFVENNTDLGLFNYSDILRENNIEYSDNAFIAADYNSMDGQGVAALIVATVRAERIYEGTIERFFQNGYVLKWLERLKSIDKSEFAKQNSIWRDYD